MSTTPDNKDTKEILDLHIEELYRNYELSLKLLQQSEKPDEILHQILEEYDARLSEIPATDILKVLSSPENSEEKLKIKSLIMFATQATLIKERTEYLLTIEEKKRQLEILAEKLKQSNEQLRQLNAHYFNMLGFVSHELRSPLISIVGFAELLADSHLGALNSQQMEAVDIIIRSANNLLNMTLKYLQLSKIENQGLSLKIETVNIQKDVITPVVIELANQLHENGMLIDHLNGDDIPDIIIFCDPELMRNVFYNLFGNAIKYGQSNTRITYEILNEPRFVKFVVENKGHGVPQEKLQLIFDKFTHLQMEVSNEKMRGTGLGLYISKLIVETHGGQIRAESDSKSWMRIIFTLPKNQKHKNPILNTPGSYSGFLSESANPELVDSE